MHASRIDRPNSGNGSHCTADLDSILALRTQLFADIDAARQSPAQEDPIQAERLIEVEKQLRDIDMAIDQVRIYLLGFHRTLANV